MARLCEMIEEFLKQLIDETEGHIEIQRNELANKFKCVPSQINYVISTRFSHERGYYVESKRGGGGHISIRRVNISTEGSYLMHIITSMGASISQQSAEIFINNFVDYEIITDREARIIKASLSDRVLNDVAIAQRDAFRATLLKNMLTSLIA